MKPTRSPYPFIACVLYLFFTGCKTNTSKDSNNEQTSASIDSAIHKTVYQSENLIVNQLSKHTFQHISFLSTEEYGQVACNGMISVHDGESIVFDTPTDTVTSQELISFVQDSLKAIINFIIPTHFHEDCVGGINAFTKLNTNVLASHKTVTLLQEKQTLNASNWQSFDTSIDLHLGEHVVHLEYFGPGHTEDNIVGYFPLDQALFGGCLVKSIGASKGNLKDADTSSWAHTVQKIKSKHPNIQQVIPGHGAPGGQELLDFTIALFSQN